MFLTFLGGAGTVTGSKTLVETPDARVLVDCGLFQGLKQLRLQNRARPPVDPGALDAVLLTHAHVDHSGYLPALAAAGFDRKVWCTEGTADLCRVLLPDAGHLQEEDARYANKRGFSRHHPALPLFTRADAERCLDLLEPVAYGVPFEPAPGVTARFRRAGHIIGSARIELVSGGQRVVFSGDIGRPADPIFLPPDSLAGVGALDAILVESTYGDRKHEPSSPLASLVAALAPVLARGGVVLIPAFAVGRAQVILHLLSKAMADGLLPAVPVFLDSPMGIDATEIYQRHVDDHRLTAEECAGMGNVAMFVRTTDESKTLNRMDGPMIVVAGSGMATGGRIVHHLAQRGRDPKNAILFAGYQAAGTRGQALLNGAEGVKIHGEWVPIRAERLRMDSLSAHADAGELLDWLGTLPSSPAKVYINHGEPAASDALRVRIRDRFGWEAEVVRPDQRVALS